MKEFYKLKKEAATEEPEITVKSQDDMDSILKNASLKDLIALENKVHYQINSNKSLIKNIIYNNYFELIKINGYLNDMVIKDSTPSFPQNDEQPEDEDDDDLVATTTTIATAAGQKKELKQLGALIDDNELDNMTSTTTGAQNNSNHILDEIFTLQRQLAKIVDDTRLTAVDYVISGESVT